VRVALTAAAVVLTPVALAVHYFTNVGASVVFALAAVALLPLAWLIGDATEQVAEHTGPGIGGFFNASFGNAPELIIALFAILDDLPEIVRGSIAGSVVSNLLLVLGATMVAGSGKVDARSLRLQLGTVFFAVVVLLVPSIPSWHGDPERHSLFLLTLPVALVLLAVYLATSTANLRRHHAESAARPEASSEGGWSMRTALLVLGVATAATALTSEVLVGSLEAFGDALGLSDFFVAIVIVAIVGNAAEHGGAIVVARRGKTALASEIAVSSSAQVALFVAPAAVLLSWAVGHELPLGFRPVELAAVALSVVVVTATINDGRSSRREGLLLLGVYAVAVIAFWLAGDR
jgi:Ca2+:H+ antiporter